jgi:hypothetical protein
MAVPARLIRQAIKEEEKATARSAADVFFPVVEKEVTKKLGGAEIIAKVDVFGNLDMLREALAPVDAEFWLSRGREAAEAAKKALSSPSAPPPPRKAALLSKQKGWTPDLVPKSATDGVYLTEEGGRGDCFFCALSAGLADVPGVSKDRRSVLALRRALGERIRTLAIDREHNATKIEIIFGNVWDEDPYFKLLATEKMQKRTPETLSVRRKQKILADLLSLTADETGHDTAIWGETDLVDEVLESSEDLRDVGVILLTNRTDRGTPCRIMTGDHLDSVRHWIVLFNLGSAHFQLVRATSAGNGRSYFTPLDLVSSDFGKYVLARCAAEDAVFISVARAATMITRR